MRTTACKSLAGRGRDHHGQNVGHYTLLAILGGGSSRDMREQATAGPVHGLTRRAAHRKRLCETAVVIGCSIGWRYEPFASKVKGCGV